MHATFFSQREEAKTTDDAGWPAGRLAAWPAIQESSPTEHSAASTSVHPADGALHGRAEGPRGAHRQGCAERTSTIHGRWRRWRQQQRSQAECKRAASARVACAAERRRRHPQPRAPTLATGLGGVVGGLCTRKRALDAAGPARAARAAAALGQELSTEPLIAAAFAFRAARVAIPVAWRRHTIVPAMVARPAVRWAGLPRAARDSGSTEAVTHSASADRAVRVSSHPHAQPAAPLPSHEP